MEMNGLMGGLYRICEWIMRFSVINVLWVICSIPFFLALLPILSAEDPGQLSMILIVSGAIAPFFLFPATAAMFAVARKWVMGDVDVPLVKTFFRGYKSNYKQSMLGGLIYSLLFLLFVVNMRFYAEMTNHFQFLSLFFMVMLVVLAVSLFHFFSILAHLRMTVLQIVKNSILITVGRPFTSILITVTNAVILYFSFVHFQWLLLFFTGSLIAYMTFMYFHRMFEKIREKQRVWQEKQTQGAEEAEEEPTGGGQSDSGETDNGKTDNGKSEKGEAEEKEEPTADSNARK